MQNHFVRQADSTETPFSLNPVRRWNRRGRRLTDLYSALHQAELQEVVGEEVGEVEDISSSSCPTAARSEAATEETSVEQVHNTPSESSPLPGGLLSSFPKRQMKTIDDMAVSLPSTINVRPAHRFPDTPACLRKVRSALPFMQSIQEEKILDWN